MNNRISTFIACVFAAALAFAPRASAEDKPKVIRIAYPGVGIGNRPYVGGNSTAVIHLKGMLEEEFKPDGIRIEWSFLRGAGPAVNELYANRLADFSLLGDLPSIVGKAGGLQTRILAATGIRGNTYLAVPADSNITSIKELKGRRIGLFKGTNTQLAVAKLLKDNGLSEKDVRFLNMDNATIRAALVTKDIEGAFGSNDLLSLRDQGAVKIIYRTNGDPRYLRQASFVGTQDFINKYPEITKRIVKTLVLGAKWISENEKNQSLVFNLWTKSGTRFADYKEDQQGQPLKALASPLLDPYFISQYKIQIAQAKEFGLIKNAFPLESWLEPKFLNQALNELGLTNYWAPADASGKLSAPAQTAAAAVPQGPVAQAAAAPTP